MKYFTIEELCRSQTATRRNIDNTPDHAAIDNLSLLVRNVLDPLRELTGRPVIVTSGYRSPRLNRAIGGSTTSQHCRGQAADIRVVGLTVAETVDTIRENFPFDQLIHEGSWTHVSFSEDRNRGQVLRAHFGRGKVQYTILD